MIEGALHIPIPVIYPVTNIHAKTWMLPAKGIGFSQDDAWKKWPLRGNQPVSYNMV
jgi:hypothetical protein